MSIYAVDARTGLPLSSLLKCTKGMASLSDMIWGIVDFCAFDRNSDGYTDRIYAGDMGGQLFALNGPSDGSAWTGNKIFQAGKGTTETAQMKFFYAPDVAVQGYKGKDNTGKVTYTINDYVYIGTGDREHPLDTAIDNRFYAVKVRDDGAVVTESMNEFRDVTFYSQGYDQTHGASYYRSGVSRGWYIRLGYELGSHVRPGEKMSSSPLVFDGVVYFITYVPGGAVTGGDRCVSTHAGESYLYAVDYLTGEAIRDFGFNATDEQREGSAPLNERNRWTLIESPLPSAPRLTMTESGPVLVVGTKTLAVPVKESVHEYFWLQ
jgi:type IV pilus assembly protein PilY1